MSETRKPLVGWRTWDEGKRCNHCCNGDRCDDPTHLDRGDCPYCLGTGRALWNERQPEPQDASR